MTPEMYDKLDKWELAYDELQVKYNELLREIEVLKEDLRLHKYALSKADERNSLGGY